jgi:hypothetical protein
MVEIVGIINFSLGVHLKNRSEISVIEAIRNFLVIFGRNASFSALILFNYYTNSKLSNLGSPNTFQELFLTTQIRTSNSCLLNLLDH